MDMVERGEDLKYLEKRIHVELKFRLKIPCVLPVTSMDVADNDDQDEFVLV